MDGFCQRATLFLKVGIETKKLTETSVENFEMIEVQEKKMMKMMKKKKMMKMKEMKMTFRQK